MNCKPHFCLLIMFFAFLSIGCNSGLAETNRELHAASVLFGRFESVYYAEGDFLSNHSALYGMEEASADSLRNPFDELLAGLNETGVNSSGDILKDSDAVLLGAREFRSPAGLGPVHSQRCYVVILRGGSKHDLHEYFRRATTESLAGMQVWKWSAKLGEFGEENSQELSTFYAVQVADSYLVISNNPGDFRVIVSGLRAPENLGAILAGIPGWEAVSKHKIWGYRRFIQHGVVDPGAAGLPYVTKYAKAFSFFVDIQKREGVVLVVSSDMSENSALTKKPAAMLPPLKRLGGGIWEARFPFFKNGEGNDRLFLVMYLLGFGAYT